MKDHNIINLKFDRICNLSVEKDAFDAYTVGSVFFSTERFQILSNLKLIGIYLRYKSLKLSTRTPVGNVFYLIRD